MGLIEEAITEVKTYRTWRNGKDLGLHNPVSMRAWHETFYLQLRQDIFKGIRVVTKTEPVKWKRSIIFQILMMAVTDIFQYGYSTAVIKPYNTILDDMIGYH